MFQAFYAESDPGEFVLVAVFFEEGQVPDEIGVDGLDTLERFRQGLELSTPRAVRVMQCGDLAEVHTRL